MKGGLAFTQVRRLFQLALRPVAIVVLSQMQQEMLTILLVDARHHALNIPQLAPSMPDSKTKLQHPLLIQLALAEVSSSLR